MMSVLHAAVPLLALLGHTLHAAVSGHHSPDWGMAMCSAAYAMGCLFRAGTGRETAITLIEGGKALCYAILCTASGGVGITWILLANSTLSVALGAALQRTGSVPERRAGRIYLAIGLVSIACKACGWPAAWIEAALYGALVITQVHGTAGRRHSVPHSRTK